ncbi:MAG: alanine racemase [Parvularculaceae bacterium]
MQASNPQLEIDLQALCANYRAMAAAAGGADAAAVVKCDAYGLGAAAVARALYTYVGCRAYFVAYPEEGAALRSALGDGAVKIYIFNGPTPDKLKLFKDYALTPVLNSIEQAKLWTAARPGVRAALHIDTGMHRSGIAPSEIEAASAIDGLNISVVMSHLACISDPAAAMNETQRAAFAAAFAKAARRFPGARASLSSSAGALTGPEMSFDLIRLGVGLYGVSPFDAGEPRIAPVARLTAPVVQTHTVKAGDTVGYGATHTAARDGVLATVLLGYGDGYPRAASNRASALIGGAACPIVGRVSMDQIVLDVSALPTPPETGEMAEFFGPGHAIDKTAADCGTIGYELLTTVGGLARPRPGLGGRVIRRYVWGDEPAPSALIGDEADEGIEK